MSEEGGRSSRRSGGLTRIPGLVWRGDFSKVVREDASDDLDDDDLDDVPESCEDLEDDLEYDETSDTIDDERPAEARL
ncbi:uncharacterized protein N0V89_007322 [Didymosphaeria variabile]|uniref:Uncharacterized protein n=1 Tax=Didymosphaeria variabile TaxID=1932322 RepID=A0A9W8XJE3_9PLEO|nr:uncharacterized protein N0V89_007322 [Didymosphaeria variabile]KAJ4351977.1 hypothetical protein N0V89_007322 [Didymosphaeria variabile]